MQIGRCKKKREDQKIFLGTAEGKKLADKKWICLGV